MPSPICTVNAASTVDGYNTTPGATVTIALVSSTDVLYWELTCYSTDDHQLVAAINANITVNQVAKTATLLVPNTARGCAIILQSRINRGVDLHGITQSSYSTTFGIFGIGGVGHRLIATKQTTEGNATFGWTEDINLILARELNKNPDFGASDVTVAGAVSCGSLNTTDITGFNSFDGFICYSTREVNASILTEDYMDVIKNDFAVIITDATVRAPGYYFSEYLPIPTLGRMVTILNDTTYSVRVYGNTEEVNYGIYFDINPIESRNYGCTLVSDGNDWFLTHPYKAPAA